MAQDHWPLSSHQGEKAIDLEANQHRAGICGDKVVSKKGYPEGALGGLILFFRSKSEIFNQMRKGFEP